MNINAASLADILKLNGIFSKEEQNGKGENGINETAGTYPSAVSYTEGAGATAGIMNENYTRRDCNPAEVSDETRQNSGRTGSGTENISAFQQVKEGINFFVNRVSADSYREYEEMGIIPDQEEPDTFLTVTERIEIELAAHCKDYTPTGSIDIDDIRAVYGDTGRTYAIANALKKQGLNITTDNISQIEEGLQMAEELGEITPEMCAYLLKNGLSISIENVYKAQYSVTDYGNSYNNMSINERDWEQLSAQITEKLENIGIPADEKTMQDARWMIENHIPVTASNIMKMRDIHTINQINSGAGLGSITDEQWISGLTAGIALGLSVSQINAGNSVSIAAEEGTDNDIISQAVEAVEILENGNDEQVEEIISQGKEVTLLNMKKVQEETVYAGNEQRHQRNQESEQKAYREKHYLEEIKLTMSVSGFALLLKNGFELQIASLQEIAEGLREQRDTYADTMLYSTETMMELPEQNVDSIVFSEKRELFWSSISYMREFPLSPAYVLGNVAAGEIAFEVQEMCIEGAVQKNILKSAMTAYETMGTRPRGDFGDSIQKAFAGINDILKDLDMEENELNHRAARILAYNEMDITQENLLMIKGLDMEVSRLIDNMTPKTTAYLIANGINPLKTDIRKLNDKLNEINEEIEADTGERFSQFLWKLDKNGDITPEDRKTFIGIYRALHTIQKSDRRAIGELVKEGGTLTIQSLLTAARSIGRHLNTAVNDETGLTEQRILPENNLDIQLEALAGYEDLEASGDMEKRYMETLINKSMDLISPQAFLQIFRDSGQEDMSLEQFVNQLMWYTDSGEQKEEESMKEYYDEIIKEDAEARFVSEKVINSLIGTGISPSISNLLAASGLMAEKGRGFLKLLGMNEEKENNQIDEIEEIEEHLMDSLEEEEKFDQAYHEMVNQVSENMGQSAYVGRLNVTEIRGMTQKISYIRQSAAKKSYYIPAQIGNSKTTIHLTLRTGGDEKGKVEIELDTEQYGTVHGELKVRKMSVVMEIQTENKEFQSRLERNKQLFAADIHTAGMTFVDSIVEVMENNSNEDSGQERDMKNEVSTERLYQLAKKFIHYIKVSAND